MLYWQFSQAVDAIQMLFRTVGLGAMDQVDRGFWRDSARAERSKRLPVVPKRSEVRRLMEGMNGSQHLMVYLLYGTRMGRPGLRAHASPSLATSVGKIATGYESFWGQTTITCLRLPDSANAPKKTNDSQTSSSCCPDSTSDLRGRPGLPRQVRRPSVAAISF
jgi:hypothetical protein